MTGPDTSTPAGYSPLNMSRFDDSRQLSLPLPALPVDAEMPLVPARMVNEWIYCPRLAYLEWVEGEWAESVDTAEGKRAHAKVDVQEKDFPTPEELGTGTARTRSIMLSSERIGAIAKMDVVEADEGVVMPVDYKKGKRPHVQAGAYEPERVQVCLQAMILEDNGYEVSQGALWYAASREKVPVILDEELRSQTLMAISDLRAAAASGHRPPPLENSPKCVRCSLAGICLPDETNVFRKGYKPRPLNPADDSALPLYVQTPGAKIRKKGERLSVEIEESKVETPIMDVSQVSLFGPVSVTTPALHEMMRADIPVSWFSTGGWFLGHTVGTGNKNVMVREAQYRYTFDEKSCLGFSRGLVEAKVRNSRTMLRRNWRGDRNEKDRDEVLMRLKRIVQRVPHTKDVQELLGVEGDAAAIYFSCFENMLSSDSTKGIPQFSFSTRNRRPPTDPVNAMLSFAYALLTRALTVELSSVGFDPYMGFYHRPRHGRPALALDIMEPFRPIVADSCVIQVVNNGEVKMNHFVFNGPACSMNPEGRKALIASFERRMEQETTHPIFGYRVSMKRLLNVQMRLLSRYLQGEIPTYPHYLPR